MDGNTRSRLRRDALLDGITGTVAIPSLVADPFSKPSKYRRGQSDVERAWIMVGRYLEVAMEEIDGNSEVKLKDGAVLRND